MQSKSIVISISVAHWSSSKLLFLASRNCLQLLGGIHTFLKMWLWHL